MLTDIHVEVLLVFLFNIVYDVASERTVNHAHSDVGGQMDLPCSYEVIVREDTPVGEVIFTFPRKQSDAIGSTTSTSETSIYRNSSLNVQPVFESIRLTDGNKNERFRVESERGDISVLGYLDHDIDSEYVLQILLQSSQNKSHSTCIVKIILEDVEGWPPFYNETCAMPTREQRKGLNIPFSLSLGKSKVTTDFAALTIHPSHFKLDSNNDKCMLTLYKAVPTWSIIKNRIFKATDFKVTIESPVNLEVNPSLYFKKMDFPPHALYDEHWFNRTRLDGTPARPAALLKFDVTNIDTRISPVPVLVTAYVGTQKLVSYDIWIEYIGCPKGKYGILCDKPCMCKNDAECSVFNGACKCKAGWYGPACDIPKPVIEIFPKHQDVEYGIMAFLTCQTRNIPLPETIQEWRNMTSWSFNDGYLVYHSKAIKLGFSNFDRVIGISFLQIDIGITDEWTGRYQCKVTDKYNRVYVASATVSTVCPKNLFGRYCNMSCDCVTGSSISCDRYVGCVCNTGWTGRYCHIDTIQPTFYGCPKEVTKIITGDETKANVTWLAPTVDDNSDNVTILNNYTPGDVFYIGTTIVRYTAVDSANNTAYCRFKVKIINQGKLRWNLVVWSVIACLVFVIPCCVYLGYRYRLQLYLLLKVEVDDFDDGGDKDYDAFVLYSSKDGDFAEDIMKRLERNGKFKLLLHHRDFIAGKPILDNIEDSFDNSRAAILVISPNFLESGTCEHEARIALDNWINRRQKLIPIAKGNIEQGNHSQVIKRIVKFITYIPWPQNGSQKEEDRFWIELENALEKRVQKHSGMNLFRRALASLSRCRGRDYSRVPNHVI
ncbi:uncharacterized protein [Ptychodera flava]|uniref:uncharacterized protein n=1 Tax=Ptychodera flava TaxID=63121 RepID=UPI00396A5C1A